MTKDPIILPEKYYLDYFNYLLDFVEKQYQHVLDFPEHIFYQDFRNLSEPAQCLYLRFLNRRGNFFRLSKVTYPEIPNVPEAKEELALQGFIKVNESNDVNQFRLFTKAELTSHFDFLNKNLRKDEILLELNELDIPAIYSVEEIAELQRNEEAAFIKLLFFGDMHTEMTEFVIRDIGNIKVETFSDKDFKPWFQSREEALGVMHITQLKGMISELKEADLPIHEYLKEMPWHVWMSHHQSEKKASKLLVETAYYLEQKGLLAEALHYYSYTDKAPSRERRTRLLEKLNEKEKAIELANEILLNPKNATEATFASDFLNRKGIRIDRSMTARLKNAPSISIPKPDERIERAVLSYFEKEGWEGIHAENYLWRGIFGLTFWQVIFDTSQGAFHHPLQRQPSDLNDEQFFESRSDLLAETLQSLKTKKMLINHIEAIHDEKYGTANRFVYWHESLLPYAKIMIDRLPLAGIKKVMQEMPKNMKENSAGFPDLFLWKGRKYRFYEVKSPNDHLSAQQLFWLDYLQSCKIKVDILRVRFDS